MFKKLYYCYILNGTSKEYYSRTVAESVCPCRVEYVADILIPALNNKIIRYVSDTWVNDTGKYSKTEKYIISRELTFFGKEYKLIGLACNYPQLTAEVK